ncbi:MAG: hypothetical protein HY704_03910 [Gemmatimonadetes bacterium]|nr:hypothetical protein [Gemmatimonadota bacterium]
MTTSDPAVAERLGRFVHDMRFEDLPRAVVEKMRVITLHDVGVALAGYPSARPFWNSIRRRATLGEGTATLLVEGLRAAPALTARPLVGSGQPRSTGRSAPRPLRRS